MERPITSLRTHRRGGRRRIGPLEQAYVSFRVIRDGEHNPAGEKISVNQPLCYSNRGLGVMVVAKRSSGGVSPSGARTSTERWPARESRFVPVTIAAERVGNLVAGRQGFAHERDSPR